MSYPFQFDEAVVQTFEEMAFLDVAPGRAEPPTEPEGGPWLSLSYSSPRSGTFALFLPKALRFAVAESIYGEEWQALEPGQLDDSLLELMNVLGGRLLSARFGATGYAMGLPTVLYDAPGEMPEHQRRVLPFHVDENELTLIWYEVSQ